MKISRKIYAFILLLAIGVIDSLLDIFISLDDTAVGVLYICCILLVSMENKRTILTIYTIALVFIVIDFVVLLCLNNNPALSVFLNLSISVMAVSVATYLVIRHNKVKNEAIQAREDHIRSLEEMLFMTSHKVRSPLCSLQGIMGLIKRDKKDHLFEYYEEIDTCIAEMDGFTRELTKFIQDKGKKQAKKIYKKPQFYVRPGLRASTTRKLKSNVIYHKSFHKD